MAGEEELLKGAIARLLQDALTAQINSSQRLTVDEYFFQWNATRTQLELVTADDDRARYRLHISARLGWRNLPDVRPKHIREVIMELRTEHKLAPRTIRHCYALMSSMFRSAVTDELITATPCVLPRGTVPPDIDSDPEWRAHAIYTREEIAALISDPRLLEWRRILTAIKFFAGLRHSEAACLRWRQIERRDPLDAILLGKTKAKKPREIPIHPTLAWLLDVWRRNGFIALLGRSPRPEDYVVPTRNGTPRQSNNCQRALLADLARLGWRRRRGHDLRRTMITLARADGARDEVLKAITHGPSRAIQEQYTSWPWAVLCTELAKLRVSIGRGIQQELALESHQSAAATVSETDHRDPLAAPSENRS